MLASLTASPPPAQFGAVVSAYSRPTISRILAERRAARRYPRPVLRRAGRHLRRSVRQRRRDPSPWPEGARSRAQRRLRAADRPLTYTRPRRHPFALFANIPALASGRGYTKLYAGLAGKLRRTRFSLSPDYIGAARWTLHGEVNGHVDLTRDLAVDGTIGALMPVGERRLYRCRALNVGCAPWPYAAPWPGIAAWSLHGARESSDIYAARRHGRAAFVLGLSTAL